MKKLILFLCVIASLAHADFPFAKRIRCEVNADGNEPVELEGLRWLQGTTPLVQLDVYRDGRPVTGVDTGTVARMVIGPTSTGTYYAASTNYAATNGAFLVQWPTVGTNSSTNVWWYTVFFERGGFRYWTGSGELRIAQTTSTAEDGLVWQTNTTCAAIAAAVDAHNADATAHDGAIAAGTNALAQVGTAYSSSTNALALAQSATGTAASASATAASGTNLATLALSGVLGVSNRVDALPSFLDVSNAWASIASTGTVYKATKATQLVASNGYCVLHPNADGTLTVISVTNSVNVYVTATNGAGYNGPPVGTVWTSATGEGEFNTGIWWLVRDSLGAVYVEGRDAIYPRWDAAGAFPTEFPGYMILPNAEAVGSLIIDWVPVTNTYTIGDMTGYLRHTNGTGYADGVLNGTNGVYWTRNGTNFWILLP